jgi:hypothetical protein
MGIEWQVFLLALLSMGEGFSLPVHSWLWSCALVWPGGFTLKRGRVVTLLPP